MNRIKLTKYFALFSIFAVTLWIFKKMLVMKFNEKSCFQEFNEREFFRNAKSLKTKPATSQSIRIQKKLTNSGTKRTKITFLKEPKFTNPFCVNNSCLQDKEINWIMFTFVKSSAQNNLLREAIRGTWASINYVEGGSFRTIFVIGRDEENNQYILDQEENKYRDILQMNISDNYRNLVYKSLASMQWASDQLPAEYLYSIVDDDMMVHMAWVQDYISETLYMVREKNWPSFPILCMYGFRSGLSPIRDKESKYYCPYKEYEWPYWPDFCLGGMYTSSVEVIHKLWVLSQIEKIVHLEDAWITGILRQKLGMPKELLIRVQPAVALHVGSSLRMKQSTKRTFMRSMWKKLQSNVLIYKDTCSCY